MSFQDKRDLWYVSGNRERGDVFAIPIIEVEEGAVTLSDDIARLKDSDIDGARRWTVVAITGEEAVEKLARFCLEDPEESLSALAEKMAIPYDTLAKYAREGKILARKSGGVWLSTAQTVRAAGIRPHCQKEMSRSKFLGGVIYTHSTSQTDFEAVADRLAQTEPNFDREEFFAGIEEAREDWRETIKDIGPLDTGQGCDAGD